MKRYHCISNVDPETKTAACSVCGPGSTVRFKPSNRAWRCAKVLAKNQSAAWKKKLREARRLLQVEAVAQKGKCGICRKTKRLILDHNHQTGAIRGALCFRCNTALGCFGDDVAGVRSVLSYLEKASQRSFIAFPYQRRGHR